MVGADGASPQPTMPSADFDRAPAGSRPCVIVIPAIFIGALSGSATGIASMRRTISGARSRRADDLALRPLQHHCALMSAALMIGHHFSISARVERGERLPA